MIHKKIEQLIPHISEDFITYNLADEGKYIPFINFWQSFDTITEGKFDRKIESALQDTGYMIEYEDRFRGPIHQYCIYPNFKNLKDGSYEFVNDNWSIEEMIDLLIEILK